MLINHDGKTPFLRLMEEEREKKRLWPNGYTKS